MKVAVVGATGKTGQAVTARLLAAGHQVRAVARDPVRAEALARKGAEIFLCDLGDPERTRAALAGREGVYYCSPLGIRQADPLSVERAWTRNALAAAKAAGIGHFVFLSVQGAGQPRGVALLENKHRLEVELEISRLPFTILRPNWFMDNLEAYHGAQLLAGSFAFPLTPGVRLQPIAIRDIAQVVARLLETGPRHRAFELVGPAPLTCPEMVEILSRALGRPVAFRQLRRQEFLDAWGPQMGLPYARIVLDLFLHYEVENPVGDAEALRREFSLELTPFEEYARELALRLKGA